MAEYTPSTEEVREQYWAASGDRRRGSTAWAEFDRWLAAHDAKVRAGVVPEEPEWEYGLMREDEYVDTWGVVSDERRELPAMRGIADVTGELIVRRRAPGPWVPVEQEGNTDD